MYLEPFCVSRSLLFTFQSRYRISPSLFIYLESFLYLTLSPFYLFRAVFVFHALSFLSIYSGSRSREMLLLQRRFAELETKWWSLAWTRQVVSDLWIPPPAKRTRVHPQHCCQVPQHQQTEASRSRTGRPSPSTSVSRERFLLRALIKMCDGFQIGSTRIFYCFQWTKLFWSRSQNLLEIEAGAWNLSSDSTALIWTRWSPNHWTVTRYRLVQPGNKSVSRLFSGWTKTVIFLQLFEKV